MLREDYNSNYSTYFSPYSVVCLVEAMTFAQSNPDFVLFRKREYHESDALFAPTILSISTYPNVWLIFLLSFQYTAHSISIEVNSFF